jgi:hypothetical protein
MAPLTASPKRATMRNVERMAGAAKNRIVDDKLMKEGEIMCRVVKLVTFYTCLVDRSEV